jgi:hypothetical protein
MTTTELLVLIALLVVAVLAVVAVVMAAKRRKRSDGLRDSFGSEYDRTVETTGKRRDAERELADRQKRHDQLEIRPLSSASRARYLTAWDGVQNRFVDSPVLALSEADALVTQMMSERGFPTDDVRTSADMLSVEHSSVLEDFRAGHAIEQANTTKRANTEQVRQGMLHFRKVFEELVSEQAEASPAPMTGEGDPGYVEGDDAGGSPRDTGRDRSDSDRR